MEEHGKVVYVTEKRPMKKGNKTGIVVIRVCDETYLLTQMEMFRSEAELEIREYNF